MNTELEKINNWYIANKLTLNFDKTSAILFSNSKNAQLSCPDVYFKFGSSKTKIERIKETESVRFLGVWLDTKLAFNDYHKKICNRLNFALYTMRKVKNFLSFESMKLLYYSFFHSHLEFSSTFLYASSTKNIESLQKQAIRLLIGRSIRHTVVNCFVSSYFSRNCCTGKETEIKKGKEKRKSNFLDCTRKTVIIITSKLIVFVN